MSNYTAIDQKVTTLPNGTIVDTENLEREIGKICHYVQHVFFAQRDQEHPIALIFPRKGLLKSPDYEKSPEDGCFCPRSLNEFGKCLAGCLDSLNRNIKPGFSGVDAAVIINTELSEEDTSSPASSITTNNIISKYRPYLDNLFGGNIPVKEEAYFIRLSSQR